MWLTPVNYEEEEFHSPEKDRAVNPGFLCDSTGQSSGESISIRGGGVGDRQTGREAVLNTQAFPGLPFPTKLEQIGLSASFFRPKKQNTYSQTQNAPKLRNRERTQTVKTAVKSFLTDYTHEFSCLCKTLS